MGESFSHIRPPAETPAAPLAFAASSQPINHSRVRLSISTGIVPLSLTLAPPPPPEQHTCLFLGHRSPPDGVFRRARSDAPCHLRLVAPAFTEVLLDGPQPAAAGKAGA